MVEDDGGEFAGAGPQPFGYARSEIRFLGGRDRNASISIPPFKAARHHAFGERCCTLTYLDLSEICDFAHGCGGKVCISACVYQGPAAPTRMAEMNLSARPAGAILTQNRQTAHSRPTHDIAVEPRRAGSVERPELGAHTRSYPLRHSRPRAGHEGGAHRRPRNFLLDRLAPPGLIGVARMLHDAMVVERHPADYDDKELRSKSHPDFIYSPSPRLRPNGQSMPPSGRATPEICRPMCRSTEGVHGTSLKPSPSSINAKRPEASAKRWR